MTQRVLTLRELNRATLARQLLLPSGRRPEPAGAGVKGRGASPLGASPPGEAPPGEAPPLPPRQATVLAALEQVAGLQAQASRAAYVGLWARVPGFERDDLTELLQARLAVKATLMRGTIHLVTAADYLRLRPAVQPLLTRLARNFIRSAGAEVSLEELRAQVEGFFARPRSTTELQARLSELHPGADAQRLGYALRVELALLHAPKAGAAWGFPAQPLLVDAASWLGRPVPAPAGPDELIRRYLQAFGPASVADMQAWSGLSGLRGAVAALAPQLAAYRTESDVELFDLPGAALPAADEAAPPALVPEWDSVLLGHQDRRRIVPEEFREPVYSRLRQLIGPAALLDGFAAGVWKIERDGGAATIAVAPFRRLSRNEREALALPGERLGRFMEPRAASAAVRIDPVLSSPR